MDNASACQMDNALTHVLPILDHTEYRPHRCFMCVTELFVPLAPTPAVWPKGGTLSSAGGPCLSGASWSAFLRLASVRSNEARRGVNGFGAFCRNKRASPAGAKPGNTEHHVGTRVGNTRAMPSPALTFYERPPRGMLDTHRQAVRPEP
jgi:hypothetical protein